MKKLLILILLFGLSQLVFAQNDKNNNLTGILSIDSKEALNNVKYNLTTVETEVIGNKKSPLLAGAMSFIVPGSGEIYTENYLKAALFVAVEVTLIYFKSEYDKKGDDKTTEFEKYAKGNWSVAKYAEWSMRRFGLYEEWSGRVLDDSEQGVNWKELNALENVISGTGDGKYYSHSLAPYEDQQYYEMIGKYTQFVAGWNDFSDPNLTYKFGGGTTENFDFYSSMRGDANDYYKNASTMMSILIVNHLVSGIDAIISANSYNKKIEVKASLAHRNLGLRSVYYPELNFRLSI